MPWQELVSHPDTKSLCIKMKEDKSFLSIKALWFTMPKKRLSWLHLLEFCGMKFSFWPVTQDRERYPLARPLREIIARPGPTSTQGEVTFLCMVTSTIFCDSLMACANSSINTTRQSCTHCTSLSTTSFQCNRIWPSQLIFHVEAKNYRLPSCDEWGLSALRMLHLPITNPFWSVSVNSAIIISNHLASIVVNIL